MLGRVFRRLMGIPRLLFAVGTLKADVEVCLQSEEVQAAWKRFTTDPAIADILPRLSAEWRAVEEAVNGLK
ncbi:MAG TPA: hypothetical protein VFB38_19525 [Chthonomonadaceae bacterium]|nr:hypothetical protein [Chthonomonadaceae bacterium]